MKTTQKIQLRKQLNKKKLKKPNKWLLPFSSERKYKALLHKLTREIRQQIKEQLEPQIPQMLQVVEATYPTNDSKDLLFQKNSDYKENLLKNDDFLDQLNSILLQIENSLKPLVEETIRGMERIGEEINDFNYQQFQKVNRSVFGVDIFIDEPYLRDQLSLFASQNSQLIKSIPEQELFEVSGLVERALVEGSTFSKVSRQLQERFGITRRRANLIARDQTTKLNGALTKYRQMSAGIETYRWQTSDDERVRASHRAMNGKICKWDDPTVWLDESTGKWVPRSTQATKNQVSVDVNCRCQPIARFEDFEEFENENS